MNQKKDISIDKYVAWLNEGKTFEDIKEDMRAQGCSEENIKLFIPYVSQKAISNDYKKVEKDNQIDWTIMSGFVSVAFGIIYVMVDSSHWLSYLFLVYGVGSLVVAFVRNINGDQE